MSIIDKTLLWAYTRCVRNLLRLYIFSLNIKIHSDFSVSILENGVGDDYIFIKHCSKKIIKDGKLIIKFREVGKFYCLGVKELTSDHNFPDKCDVLCISGTGITKLNLNHINSTIMVGDIKLKKLSVKSIGEKFYYHGDMSQLNTLAYIPTHAYGIIWNEPFNHYCTEDYKNLTIEDTPRTQLLLEMIFLITKKKITNLEVKKYADPNHYYSRLFFMMNAERNVLGTWEPWKDHLKTIEWPKDFLNKNTKKSADNLVKFNL